MNPQFADEKPLNPFDLWEGASFKIKIRQVEGYRNYDKSEFSDRGPLNNDDGELERIWKSAHSLQAFLDPKNFKEYDTLKTKLNDVLGLTAKVSREFQEDAPVASAPKLREVSAPSFEASAAASDDDDDLSYFKKLAND
jgi:predicted DNA-binding antitoxin AbrB/MazE fold protein